MLAQRFFYHLHTLHGNSPQEQEVAKYLVGVKPVNYGDMLDASGVVLYINGGTPKLIGDIHAYKAPRWTLVFPSVSCLFVWRVTIDTIVGCNLLNPN